MNEYFWFWITHGPRLSIPDDPYFPIEVAGAVGETLALSGGATHFGMIVDGDAALTDSHGTISLSAGMFFVAVGGATLDAAGGRALTISARGYVGLRQIGGPIEATGRLRYIDGCSDTLLVSPPRLGEPCLNHLHIPPNTSQSQHTHPSERIGVILRGHGECRTAEGPYPLAPGVGWRIPAGCVHSFFTADESLDVLAWHPDSDFGPTDDNHPMRNKTILTS